MSHFWKFSKNNVPGHYSNNYGRLYFQNELFDFFKIVFFFQNGLFFKMGFLIFFQNALIKFFKMGLFQNGTIFVFKMGFFQNGP